MSTPTLANQAMVILQEVIVSAAAVRDFVLAEAPDVIHQLLAWNLIVHSMRFFFGVAIMIGLILFVKWEIKFVKKHWKTIARNRAEAVLMFNALLFMPFFLSINFFNLIWLQILVAPKLFLIEFAAQLMK